jgi:uncharacterized protein YdcH (DUF465 family)
MHLGEASNLAAFKKTNPMEKHDLHHEFPQFDEKIHALKISDHHFKRLFDEYHEVNKDIHAIETGAVVTTDEVLNQLRLKRVHLKDELYGMLVAD